MPNRVPNLSDIGAAALEIWNRHPARAHVQGRSKFTLPRHPILTGPYQYTKFERDRSSRSRDVEHRCLAARAHVQSHPNCDT